MVLTILALDRPASQQLLFSRMGDAGKFYLAVGREIQTRRRGRLTQEQLASRLEPPLTRAAIANIEAGKQGVLLYTLVQIASHLGVPPADLLPSSSVAMSSEQLESELVKACVPLETSRRLTKTMLADTGGGRSHRGKRSDGKGRR